MKALTFLAIMALAVFATTSLATYVGIFLPATAGPVSVGTLSERSRAFVSSQQDRGSARWQQLNVLGARSDQGFGTETPIATPCFSLLLPWSSSHHREEVPTEPQSCVFKAKLLNPLSRLVVAQYSSPDFNQDSHVAMRRSQPELYQELNLNPPAGFAHASLFTTTQEKTLFVHDGRSTMISVAIAELAQPELITLPDLQTLLASITFLRSPIE